MKNKKFTLAIVLVIVLLIAISIVVAIKTGMIEKNNKIVYRWSTDSVKIDDTIDTSDTAKFTKDSTTLGKNYYLKHMIDKDNKVIESYACLKYNDKEICLRGGSSAYYGYADKEEDYTDNMLILKKLKNEGFTCSFSDNFSGCANGSVRLNADSNGFVDVYDSDGDCFIYLDGSSNCGN